MDIYIPSIPYPLICAAGAAAAAVGIWRGGRDGAVVAAVVLTHIGLALAIERAFPLWLSITEDIVTLAICLTLTITGRNYWTIVAAATQVLSCMTQVLRMALGLTGWGYYSAQTTWFLLLVFALGVGPLLAPSRRLREA